MTDWVLILVVAMVCYVLLAHLEHKKKIDMIDRGLWKPDEKTRNPEHRLITGAFFLILGLALLMGSYSVEADLMDGLRISGLLTIAAGIGLMIAYIVGKRTVTPV